MIFSCIEKKKVIPLHPQTRKKNLLPWPDSVAQLVEHDTLNVGVLGSIPSRVTGFIQFIFHFMKGLGSSVGRAQHF